MLMRSLDVQDPEACAMATLACATLGSARAAATASAATAAASWRNSNIAESSESVLLSAAAASNVKLVPTAAGIISGCRTGPSAPNSSNNTMLTFAPIGASAATFAVCYASSAMRLSALCYPSNDVCRTLRCFRPSLVSGTAPIYSNATLMQRDAKAHSKALLSIRSDARPETMRPKSRLDSIMTAPVTYGSAGRLIDA